MKNTQQFKGLSKQTRGFVLFPSLIFVLLMIFLALYMMRGVNVDEKMAANTREKSRATEAAQGAMNYAEWWLLQGANATDGTGNACLGVVSTPTILPSVCVPPGAINIQGNAQLPQYTVYPLSSNTSLVASTTGGSNTYYADPNYSIYYVGLNSINQKIYSVYALGYGGNAQSLTVLQSLFYVQQSAITAGGGQ